MKKKFFQSILLMLIMMLCVNTFSVMGLPASDVSLKYYVNDYTGILSEEEIGAITTVSESLYNRGVADYVVVVIDSLEGMPIEEYALKLAENEIGLEDKDNGFLLLVSLNDKQFRIEIGYGLEGSLNDAKLGRIAREVLVPNFRNEQYGSGIAAFSYRIHDELLPGKDLAGKEIYSKYNYPEQDSGKFGWANILDLHPFITILIIVIILRILFAIVFTAIRRFGKKIFYGRSDEDSFAAAVLAALLEESKGKGGESGWNLGSNRGGSSGSSFRGRSGGGRFGGGGFSGRW